MKNQVRIMVTALLLGALLPPVAALAQTVDVAGRCTVADPKLDGVGWDGENIWVITYQSSPIEWRLARLGPGGEVLSSFVLPATSRGDVHNMGMSNVTADDTSRVNDWNAGSSTTTQKTARS